MKKLGFVFSSAPHGMASGREGLDAVLATSNYTENIVLFFVGDGVMQLVVQQRPELILCRDYISTFKMLSLCGVENICVCKTSLFERGLHDVALIVEAEVMDVKTISERLRECEKLLRF